MSDISRMQDKSARVYSQNGRLFFLTETVAWAASP